MNRAVVDDAFRARLDEFRTQTELCDKEGRVIGVYTPTPDQLRRWYDWAKARHTENDEKELDRICAEPVEKTTEEVLKSLGAS
jgi:hypothetical protein